MRRFISIPFLAILCLTLAACGARDVYVGPKIEAVSYSEKVIEIGQPFDLFVECDSGRIDVYKRDENSIKLEVTSRVRGAAKKETLEKQLQNFEISAESSGTSVTFKSKYRGRIEKPFDTGIELGIYVPKKVRSIGFKLGEGRIRMLDDIKCTLKADIKTANVEVNRFEGLLNLKADICTLRIWNGRIYSGSSVSVNMGGIYVKSDFAPNGTYTFKTGVGAVELYAPKNLDATFESIGNVKVNEFPPDGGHSKIRLETAMGDISVFKY